MEIPYAGQMTVQDFVRAQVLYARPTRRGTVLRVCAAGLPVLWLALGVYPLVANPQAFVEDPFSAMGLFFPLVLLGAILTPWWYPRLMAGRAWRTHASRDLHEPQSGVFSEEGWHLRTAIFEGNTAWAAFEKFKRSADTVILYRSARLLNICPRSFFHTDGDWQAFNDLVASKLPEADMLKGRMGAAKILTLAFVVLLALVACVALFIMFVSPA